MKLTLRHDVRHLIFIIPIPYLVAFYVVANAPGLVPQYLLPILSITIYPSLKDSFEWIGPAVSPREISEWLK